MVVLLQIERMYSRSHGPGDSIGEPPPLARIPASGGPAPSRQPLRPPPMTVKAPPERTPEHVVYATPPGHHMSVKPSGARYHHRGFQASAKPVPAHSHRPPAHPYRSQSAPQVVSALAPSYGSAPAAYSSLPRDARLQPAHASSASAHSGSSAPYTTAAHAHGHAPSSFVHLVTHSSAGSTYTPPSLQSSSSHYQTMRAVKQQHHQPPSHREQSHSTHQAGHGHRASHPWSSSSHESSRYVNIASKDERVPRRPAVTIQMPQVEASQLQGLPSHPQSHSSQTRHTLYPARMEPMVPQRSASAASSSAAMMSTMSSGTRNWQWHHQTVDNPKRADPNVRPDAQRAESLRSDNVRTAGMPTSDMAAMQRSWTLIATPQSTSSAHVSEATPSSVSRTSHVPKAEMDTNDVGSVMDQLSTVLTQRCPNADKLYTLTAILLQAMDNGLTCARAPSPQATTDTAVVKTAKTQHEEDALEGNELQSSLESKFSAISASISAENARLWQSQVTNDPMINSGNGQFWCSLCRQHFVWRRDLEFHYLSHRSSHKPSVCHICGKCFTRGEHTNRHAYMHNMKDYVCQLCGSVFPRVSHLEDHWRTAHFNMGDNVEDSNQEPEWSENVDQAFEPKSPESNSPPSDLLSRYMDLISGLNPSKVGKWQSRIRKDPATHAATGDYWCSLCQKTFTWRHQLEFHFLSHRTTERSSVCHVCGKCFTRGDHTNRHAYMHSMKDFVCQLCGEVFCRVSYLADHWMKEHFAGVEDQGVALDGSDQMSDDNLDEAHNKPEAMDVDSNNGRTNGMPESLSALSDVSPDSFLGRLLDSTQAPEPPGMDYAPSPVMRSRRRRDRRLSLLSNNSPPPGRDTSDDDPLFEPASTSSGNSRRPYRCDVCARAFSRLAHLQRHARVHTGTKPFKCSLCGRSFTRADYLRAHVLLQHDRNVILCKTCGREFSTMGALTNHQKTHLRDKGKKGTTNGQKSASPAEPEDAHEEPMEGVTDESPAASSEGEEPVTEKLDEQQDEEEVGEKEADPEAMDEGVMDKEGDEEEMVGENSAEKVDEEGRDEDTNEKDKVAEMEDGEVKDAGDD